MAEVIIAEVRIPVYVIQVHAHIHQAVSAQAAAADRMEVLAAEDQVLVRDRIWDLHHMVRDQDRIMHHAHQDLRVRQDRRERLCMGDRGAAWTALCHG